MNLTMTMVFSIIQLDDYHSSDSQPVDQALTFLIEHLPPQMHLVIATREDPRLPLSRLRVRGQLTELRGADYLKVFQADQLQSLAIFFLNLHHNEYWIAQIFFGVWLFPLGFISEFGLTLWLLIMGVKEQGPAPADVQNLEMKAIG